MVLTLQAAATGQAAEDAAPGMSGQPAAAPQENEAEAATAVNAGAGTQSVQQERTGARDTGGTEQREGGRSVSALSHLLSKLNGNIDEASLMSIMAGGGGSLGGGGSYKARYKELVERLTAPENDSQLLAALEELSDLLAMSQEEQLLGFPLDTIAPVLANILQQHEDQPNILLYAARVVTWLADILPSSCAVLARHNIITALCGQLLVIGFMDVAEQCLTALEKLAQHVPESCLRQVRLLCSCCALPTLCRAMLFSMQVAWVFCTMHSVVSRCSCSRCKQIAHAKTVSDALPSLPGSARRIAGTYRAA